MRDVPGQPVDAQVQQLAQPVDLQIGLLLYKSGISNVVEGVQAQLSITVNGLLREGDSTRLPGYLPYPHRHANGELAFHAHRIAGDERPGGQILRRALAQHFSGGRGLRMKRWIARRIADHGGGDGFAGADRTLREQHGRYWRFHGRGGRTDIARHGGPVAELADAEDQKDASCRQSTADVQTQAHCISPMRTLRERKAPYSGKFMVLGPLSGHERSNRNGAKHGCAGKAVLRINVRLFPVLATQNTIQSARNWSEMVSVNP
nr:hypothetical protein [Sphingobium sp. EM0848]